MSKEELKVEVNIILDDLGLSDSRTVVGDKLSGGQKRKLSVGIALIGDPRVSESGHPLRAQLIFAIHYMICFEGHSLGRTHRRAGPCIEAKSMEFVAAQKRGKGKFS